jgi:AcrR family transcriptional regulator
MNDKMDPRAKRTRLLILNAFIALSEKKEFKDITIGDIAEKAMVNRATFYAHFADKYELLDTVISYNFREKMQKKLNGRAAFDQSTTRLLFLAICEYHQELSDLCSRNYNTMEMTIQKRIIDEIQAQILQFLDHRPRTQLSALEDRTRLGMLSTVLAWSMYGAAFKWNKEGRTVSAETLAELVLPTLEQGIRDLWIEEPIEAPGLVSVSSGTGTV